MAASKPLPVTWRSRVVPSATLPGLSAWTTGVGEGGGGGGGGDGSEAEPPQPAMHAARRTVGPAWCQDGALMGVTRRVVSVPSGSRPNPIGGLVTRAAGNPRQASRRHAVHRFGSPAALRSGSEETVRGGEHARAQRPVPGAAIASLPNDDAASGHIIRP